MLLTGAVLLAQLAMFHAAQWSPDGQQLLISTHGDARLAGVIFDVRTSRLREIDGPEYARTARSWTRSSRSDVVVRERTAPAGQDVILERPNRPAVRLNREQWAEQAQLSPDRTRVIYEARDDAMAVLSSYIVLVDTAGRMHRRLYRGTDPSWSPDGRTVLMKTPVAGKLKIATVDVGSGTAALLTDGVHPVWSPDGKFIAYMVDSGTRSDIWIMNRDGSGPRCATCSYKPH